MPRLPLSPLLLAPRRHGARRARVFGNRSGTEPCCTSDAAFAALRNAESGPRAKAQNRCHQEIWTAPFHHLLFDHANYQASPAYLYPFEQLISASEKGFAGQKVSFIIDQFHVLGYAAAAVQALASDKSKWKVCMDLIKEQMNAGQAAQFIAGL